jgi:hypothetical protein
MLRHALAASLALATLTAPLAFAGCKDLKIEDPLYHKDKAYDDDETLRQDAAYTRTFSDTKCPRAQTTLTRRPDVAADVYDVQACGNALRLKCTSESVSTRSNRTGEHKAQMVYTCTPYAGPDGGAAPPVGAAPTAAPPP